MILEAKKRGFKYSIKYKSVIGKEIIKADTGRFYYDNNQLCFCGGTIFYNGTWAEIIKLKQMKKEEIEKELGYEIEIKS